MRVLALKLAYALTRVYKRLRLPGIPGVLVVLSYEDMVVLVRHTYGTDDWTLPGGLRWWHESAHARARKEIAEELGITPPQLTSLGEVRSGNSKLELFTGELDDWRTRRNVELAEVGFFKKSQLPALGDAACIAIQRFGWELPAVES